MTELFKIIAHVGASISFLYAIFMIDPYGEGVESVMHQIFLTNMQIKYILIAIFVELGALASTIEEKSRTKK